MKTEDIVQLDLRVEGNAEKLQKFLRKIKPFAKYEDEKVPMEAIEKFIGVVCRKYHMEIQYMMVRYLKGDLNCYTLSAKKSDTHEWLGSAYGMDVYEVFAKMAIMMFSAVKKGEVRLRKE